MTNFSAMLCVEFPRLQYIDWGELIYVLKAVAIVTSEHNFIDDFLVSYFWRTFDYLGVPWMEVKPRFRDPEKVSFSPE